MLFQTLRYAVRRLLRRPGTAAVHLGGLAVGLACCFLALLFARDELSFDRFHAGAERIVEVGQRVKIGDREMTFRELPEGGVEVLSSLPGVQAFAATTDAPAFVRRGPGTEAVDVESMRFADPGFLDVFSFPLVRGSAQALAEPGRAFLTETLAHALFGDGDPVGQSVQAERTGFGVVGTAPTPLTVAGIVQDPPANSTIQFDLLVAGSTQIEGYDGEPEAALHEDSPTYVRLAQVSDTLALNREMARLFESDDHFMGSVQTLGTRTPRLVDKHLEARPDALLGGPLFYLLLGTVAGLVLLLACVNYATLATAQAMGRATEVGVRKTLGAGRAQLAGGFLAEALVLSLAAGALAVVVTAAGLPAFNAFFEKGVALGSLGALDWTAAAALVLATGLVAGAYPAAVLARFRPASALRGAATRGRSGTRVRQALVVFQFAVTAVLLASTVVVLQQISASRSASLGFAGDRVVALGLHAPGLGGRSTAIQSAIEGVPGVERVSLASGVPGRFNFMQTAGPVATADDPADDLTVMTLDADAAYPETFGLTLAAGEWVSDAHPDGVVLNETAARQLGLMTTDPAHAIGQSIARYQSQDEVVGVVRDFHLASLRSEIEPLAVFPNGPHMNASLLAVQLAATDARTLDAVEAAWNRVAPEYPFAPEFVTDTFAEGLQADRTMGQLFGALGLVAVLLACAGVFGLAAHAAERRTKEIGIRKVLGASVAGLVARLSGEFARLVVVALAVAAPVVVVLAQRWLQDFAYPAPLSAGPFVVVGLGVLALALLTSGVHAVRAARADPVRALRSE